MCGRLGGRRKRRTCIDIVDREIVRSSAIRAVGYDRESLTLEVEFHKGPVYRFEGVPEFLHRGFMASRSKEKFFHTRIVDRYPSQQIR